MAKLVNKYVQALLQLSRESGTMTSDVEEGALLRDVFTDEEIREFMRNPGVSNGDKDKFIISNFEGKVNQNFISFLRLIIKNSRESYIYEILSSYVREAKKELGQIEATVVSAVELTDNQIDQIDEILEKKFNKSIEFTNRIDEDLIGGFYILVDGQIYDTSIRTKLNRLTDALERGSIV